MARGQGVALSVAGLILLGLVLAPTALATNGAVTRAEANPTWTQASIAGSVTWTGCVNAVSPPASPPEPGSPPSGPEAPYCGWRAFATVGPSGDCSTVDSDWPTGYDGTTVWTEDLRTDLATVSFDLPQVPLGGEPGQYVCLGVVEVAQTGRTLPCAPPGEPIPPGWHCPYVMASYLHILASTALQTEPPALGSPDAGSVGEAPHRRCRAGKHGVAHADKRRCGNHHHRRHSHATKI